MARYRSTINRYLSNIKKGKHDQIFDLIHFAGNHMRGIACHYLVNKSHCDDVITDACERAYIYIKYFDEDKDGYNWLCKIIENIARDYNREDLKYVNSEMQSVIATNTNNDLDAALFKVDLNKALQDTDEINREIAFRRYILDETEEAIGKALGISKSGVCQRLKKIRQLISKYFKYN